MSSIFDNMSNKDKCQKFTPVDIGSEKVRFGWVYNEFNRKACTRKFFWIREYVT